MRGVSSVSVGDSFGRLTVIRRAPRNEAAKNRAVRWACRCACGAEVDVRSDQLRGGITKSCGCLSRDTAIATHTKHGHAAGAKLSREYTAWVNMRKRCSDQSSRHWKNYGGRGIRVCGAWESSFEAFLAAVGKSPGKGYELDRINNDGNYEPGNVRWATRAENIANRRVTRRGANG
jgi:hypothetical protein